MGNTVGINLQPVSDQTPGILNRITAANKLLMTSSDGKSIQQVDPSSIIGVGTIPAPDYVAASNVTLSGSQIVDGATPATGKVVLCVAQTNPAENGYQVANTTGAWTRPSYYNSDATVVAALGQPSGAALNGALTKGLTYRQFSGNTIAGAKIWVPSRAPAKINPKEAPWFLQLDGSDETAASDLLFAYCTSLIGSGGCTIEWPAGTLGRTSPVPVIQYCSMVGAGRQGTVFQALNPYGTAKPFDTVHGYALLNSGGPALSEIRGIRAISAWTKIGGNTWAPSTAYGSGAVGKYFFPHKASSKMLKLVTAGTSGAHPPLGELTAVHSAARLVGIPAIACAPLLKFITGGQLGTATIQISVDNGSSWSSTLPTVAGDYQLFPLSPYAAVGATYGILLSNYAGGYPGGGAIVTPTPRIDVLGSPDSDDRIVDAMVTTNGPLGTAVVKVGTNITAEKWNDNNAGLVFSSNQNTASGAYWDYSVPGTSLTVRFYAGVYVGIGGADYVCTSTGWSMYQALSAADNITDGTAAWQVVDGPSCWRLDALGQLTLADIGADGGSVSLTLCQAEGVALQGACLFNNPWLACVWCTNGDGKYGEYGQFTNQISVDDSLTIFSQGWGVLDEGGVGLSLTGTVGFQRADYGFMYMAGRLGGHWSGSYLECGRGMVRDTSYVSRRGAGRVRGVTWIGNAWGAVVGATHCVDLRGGCTGCSFIGNLYSGSSGGLKNVSDCVDLIVTGSHISDLDICDSQPFSGCVYNNQVSTAIGATIACAGSLAIANGSNNNITLPFKATAELSGLSGAANITGLVPRANVQRILIRNRTAFEVTLTHNSGASSVGNRILCPGGVDLRIVAGGWAYVEQSVSDGAWAVLSHSSYDFKANNAQSGTTYTFVLGDIGRCVDSTNAAAQTYTVPPASTTRFPPGVVLSVCALGAGAATIAAGAGVTIRYPNGKSVATTASQYATIAVRLTDTADTWVAMGNLL